MGRTTFLITQYLLGKVEDFLESILFALSNFEDIRKFVMTIWHDILAMSNSAAPEVKRWGWSKIINLINKTVLLRERKRHYSLSPGYPLPPPQSKVGTSPPVHGRYLLPHPRQIPPPPSKVGPPSILHPLVVDKVKTLPSVILRMRAVNMTSWQHFTCRLIATLEFWNVVRWKSINVLSHLHKSHKSFTPQPYT